MLTNKYFLGSKIATFTSLDLGTYNSMASENSATRVFFCYGFLGKN